MPDLSHVIQHLFHPRSSNNHRPRLLHPLPLVWLTLIVVGSVLMLRNLNNWGHILGYASSITPSQVIEATNKERALKGLSPLVLNETLSAAALAKGQDMFDKQYWAHTSPEGVEPWTFIKQAGYTYQAAGENLARDFSTTTDMMAAWMASPTHRANIINTKYDEIGIAVIDGELQGIETTLVVQMFGRPQVKAASINEEASTTITEPALAAVEQVKDSSLANTETGGNSNPRSFATPAVLASFLVPMGELSQSPLITPLQLIKAVFLAIVIMVVLTLLYDFALASNKNAVRLVGKNVAHILLLTTVAFIIIFFKGGLIN